MVIKDISVASELLSDHLNSLLCFTIDEQPNEGQPATPQSNTLAVSVWNTKK